MCKMKVTIEKMSQPVKVMVKIDAKNFKEKKDKTYNVIKKDLPQMDGFRKGNIPRNIAEQHFDVEMLYKSLIDSIYLQIAAENDIVASSEFSFFGDLKNDAIDFSMSFKAEIKPDIKLPEMESLNIPYVKSTVNDEEIDNKINLDLSKEDKIVDSNKEILDNFDIAVIDFEGFIEDEKQPFKGGTGKNYNLCINELKNGKKQFIDNFEDQLLGMKINEEREVNVMFPEDYRDKTKSGKKAKFKVKLNMIKQKIKQELNEEFIIGRGYKTIDEYRQAIIENLFETLEKNYNNNFKRIVISSIKEKCKFSPIPETLVRDEITKNWNSYLIKLGKNEKDFLKGKVDAKTNFYDNNHDQALETVKITLVLESIVKKYNIITNEKEVEEHIKDLSKILSYDDEKTNKMLNASMTNKQQYKLMEKMKLNEKAIDFVVNMFKK